MSENLAPRPSVKEWLAWATKRLRAVHIPSARLDSELILAHTLRHARTYLHAYPEVLLTSRQQEIADARLSLRLDRVPVAYIIGHKEFYGRSFRVTTATLIPRPESEALIELLKKAVPQNTPLLDDKLRLVDVGTGSGILGITAKLLFPELSVTLSDISRHALKIAEQNATELKADVEILQSDLLTTYPFVATIIIANLPYVDPEWEELPPELNHEPADALFASQNGLSLIYALIDQTPDKLASGGYLILEADPEQHGSIIARAKKHGLVIVDTLDYGILLQKLS